MRLRLTLRRLIRAVTTVTVLAFLVVLCLYVLNARSRSRNGAEQYAVWSAFINTQVENNDHDWGAADDKRLVVIHGRTVRHFSDKGTFRDAVVALLSPLSSQSRDLETESQTFRDFLLRNLWRESIARRFSITDRYELATDHDIDRFWTGNVPSRFAGHYGYVDLSAVGFNEDRTEAFFRADHLCGLCGGGGYVLMRKTEGTWRLVDWDLDWVS